MCGVSKAGSRVGARGGGDARGLSAERTDVAKAEPPPSIGATCLGRGGSGATDPVSATMIAARGGHSQFLRHGGVRRGAPGCRDQLRNSSPSTFREMAQTPLTVVAPRRGATGRSSTPAPKTSSVARDTWAPPPPPPAGDRLPLRRPCPRLLGPATAALAAPSVWTAPRRDRARPPPCGAGGRRPSACPGGQLVFDEPVPRSGRDRGRGSRARHPPWLSPEAEARAIAAQGRDPLLSSAFTPDRGRSLTANYRAGC